MESDIEFISTNRLLISIQYVCEALIACSNQIDNLIRNKDDPKCGKKLFIISNEVKNVIQNMPKNTHCFEVLLQIANVIQNSIQDQPFRILSNFIHQFGKSLVNNSTVSWIAALDSAINEIKQDLENTPFLQALIDTRNTFLKIYYQNTESNVNFMNAFEQATYFIQERSKCTYNTDTTFDNGIWGPAGIHAIGICMRGLYEGLKVSNAQTFRKSNQTLDVIEIDL